MIVWGAVLPDITYGNNYAEVHRVNGTMINQNDANAALISELGYKTVAVIHDTTDYGKGHNKYFSEALAKIGKAKIVGTFGVTADQQDFTAELTKIKALNPDVIYFGGLTPIGVRIRSQMDKLGIKAVFDGTSGIVSDAFIQGLGPLAEGTLAFREGAPTDKLPGGKFFMEKYAAPEIRQPARGLWRLRLRGDEPDPRHHREGRAQPQEGRRRARQCEGPRIRSSARSPSTTTARTPSRRSPNTWSRTASSWCGTTANTPAASASCRARSRTDAQGGAAGGAAPPSRLRKIIRRIQHMDAGLLAQFVMNGLMLGMMYALVAVGFTLFFGVLDVIQFSPWRRAHGRRLRRARDLSRPQALGGDSPWLELAVILVAGDGGDGAARRADRALSGDAVALGAAAQHAADHADARHGAARMRAAVLSAGRQSEAVSGAAAARLGRPRRLQPAARQRADAGGRRAVIVGLQFLLNRTKLGLAIRAVAQDEETARTMGINFTAIVLHHLRASARGSPPSPG